MKNMSPLLSEVTPREITTPPIGTENAGSTSRETIDSNDDGVSWPLRAYLFIPL